MPTRAAHGHPKTGDRGRLLCQGSSHGTGRALDLPEWSCYGFGSARYLWLVENGPDFGWVAPSWARQTGSNPEYWHFEYTG